MTTIENYMWIFKIYKCGIYLFEMTITENGNYSSKLRNEGIYLLEMATTENVLIWCKTALIGIYLLEMTATESLLRIQIFSRSVFTCLEWQPSKTMTFHLNNTCWVLTCLKWQPSKTGRCCYLAIHGGIDLLEMTTIENYHIILISDDC